MDLATLRSATRPEPAPTEDPNLGMRLLALILGHTDASNAQLTRLLSQAGGDPVRALGLAAQGRIGPQENDPALRNAEHALFSQNVLDRYPFATPVFPALVGGYTLAKMGAQALPESAGQALDRVSPTPLYNASRPSYEEFLYGLLPYFKRLGTAP